MRRDILISILILVQWFAGEDCADNDAATTEPYLDSEIQELQKLLKQKQAHYNNVSATFDKEVFAWEPGKNRLKILAVQLKEAREEVLAVERGIDDRERWLEDEGLIPKRKSKKNIPL